MTEGKGLICWQNQAIILPPLAIHPKSRCIAQDGTESDLHRGSSVVLVLPIGAKYLVDDGLVDAALGELSGDTRICFSHLLGMPLFRFGIALLHFAHLFCMPLFRFGISFVRKLQDLSAHGFLHLSLQGHAADIIYAC